MSVKWIVAWIIQGLKYKFLDQYFENQPGQSANSLPDICDSLYAVSVECINQACKKYSKKCKIWDKTAKMGQNFAFPALKNRRVWKKYDTIGNGGSD